MSLSLKNLENMIATNKEKLEELAIISACPSCSILSREMIKLYEILEFFLKNIEESKK